MPLKSNLRKLSPILVILAMMLSNMQSLTAYAQSGDGLKRQVNAESHKVSFVGPASGRVLPSAKALGTSIRPQDPAMALAKRFAPEFGLQNPERDLAVMKNHYNADGRLMVRYQQKYQGIPVIGGELIVHTNDNGDLYSMSGEVSPDISIATQPTVASEQARETALKSIAKWYRKSPEDFSASPAELWIYDESLLRPSTRPVELVWRMEVTPKNLAIPVREFVLINALRNSVSLHFNQVDTALEGTRKDKNIQVSGNTTVLNSEATALSALVSTYTANNTSTLPGSLLCTQADPNCTSGDSHAKAAHTYAIGTDNFYATKFSRNSIDNNGMVIKSTVHYCDSASYFGCPYYNAFWSGTQMVYGDGYGFALADDVVAHELTHGVTQYESSLFYLYQSGAINESFSDAFGEYYDQTNGLGSDGVKWQVGEDITDLGAIRSMSNPPDYDNPDKMSSPLYSTDGSDNGGVHSNSGINNKAVYLMVEGGTFNGQTIMPLGWEKVGAIYYEVNTNLLTSGSDYSDLYYALQQACTNLLDQQGITSGDCAQVKNALDAVEMNGQPVPNFNMDAPLCDNGKVPSNIVFADDLENGAGNWSFHNGAITRWQIDSALYGPNAQSGLHSLFAAPYQDAVSDTNARLVPFVVPANGYLWFAQTYEFESFYTDYFDGGVLEYSTNGGSTWQDAGSLIDNNGYNGAISNDYGNPIGGRSGFVASSHGYISTRLNLSSLAGQNVTFRWRMGLDGLGLYGEEEIGGWWVDNVKAYTCGEPAAINVKLGPGLIGSYTVPPGTGMRRSYAGANNGPVKVESTNDFSIVASQSVIFGGVSYSEMMGLPAEQLSKEYWFPYYNNVAMNSQLRVSNLSGSSTTITVYLGTQQIDSFTLGGNGAIRKNYTGKNDGPLRVTSSDTNILSTIRVLYGGSSYSEMMGLPKEQLTKEYLFPYYNNVAMDSQLRVSNLSNQSTTIKVYLGTQQIDSYTLAGGGATRKNYTDKNGGPLKVTSSASNILSTIRVLFNGSSYSEMMGLPLEQLTQEYWYPVYDNSALDSQLRVSNVGGGPTTITVYAGSTQIDSYSLIAGAATRKNYPQNTGPLHVVSSPEPILSTIRMLYTTPTFTSYYEMMGLPDTQLSTQYFFPWYNNVAMDSQLRFSVP